MSYSTEDVFISYSSKDHAAALEIKELLEMPPRSVSCWMANDVTISGGDDFRARIVEAIRRCKVFLFILSDSSMQSHWCSLELSFAILENKKIYSIRLDNAPISDICSFKLGCAQISDGTINFEAVIESLAINIKNGRDQILEEEQRRLVENKKHGFVGYALFAAIRSINRLAFLISLIVLIAKISAAGGILALLSAPSDTPGVQTVLLAFTVLSISLLNFLPISLIILAIRSRILTYAKMDSPSALYAMYIIMTRCDLFLMIFGRKKALEYLQRSAELGYPAAIKRLEAKAVKAG